MPHNFLDKILEFRSQCGALAPLEAAYCLAKSPLCQSCPKAYCFSSIPTPANTNKTRIFLKMCMGFSLLKLHCIGEIQQINVQGGSRNLKKL